MGGLVRRRPPSDAVVKVPRRSGRGWVQCDRAGSVRVPTNQHPTAPPRVVCSRTHSNWGLLYVRVPGDGDWGAIKNQVSEICDLLNAFGAEHLVLLNSLYIDMSTGERVAPSQLNGGAWQKQLETLDAIGNYTSANGITSVYHPHADSVIQYEDQI